MVSETMSENTNQFGRMVCEFEPMFEVNCSVVSLFWARNVFLHFSVFIHKKLKNTRNDLS